jgi:anthranilate phosphoribosyltransferase
MSWNENSLKDFGQAIQKLINGENLTRQKVESCFKEILQDKQPELHQGAFLSALVAKRETLDEIIGAWEAIVNYDTVKLTGNLPENLFENSGTGMDRLKTFNVSSAAAIVAAAAGVAMARHGARALSSVCGTIDILESVGVNVECDASIVENSINNAGIGVFNGMSAAIHPLGLFRILKQIRFGSTLNIAASLANPAKPTMALRGVYKPELIAPVTEIMKGIGYKKGMVVHGFDNENVSAMDEISILGPTMIRFFSVSNEDEDFTINPSDFGIVPAQYADIAPCANLIDESKRFISVLSGKGYLPCVDFTCLNSSAILKVTGKVSTLQEGFKMSKKIIESGEAIDKLHKWVQYQGYNDGSGLMRFEKLLETLG